MHFFFVFFDYYSPSLFQAMKLRYTTVHYNWIALYNKKKRLNILWIGSPNTCLKFSGKKISVVNSLIELQSCLNIEAWQQLWQVVEWEKHRTQMVGKDFDIWPVSLWNMYV